MNEIFWIIVHILCILILIFQKRFDDVAMILNAICIVLHGVLAVLEWKESKK